MVRGAYGHVILLYYQGIKEQFFKMGLKHIVMMLMMAFSKLHQPAALLKVTLIHG